MPSTSKAQHGAMCAACHARSQRGIPRKVGCEFCKADQKAGKFKQGKSHKSDVRKDVKAAHY